MSHYALALYWCDCGQCARLDYGRHARASLLAWKGESMRLISWNVNGLRAVMKKGFEDIVAEFDADVFALQETKLQAGQATLDLPQYLEFWSYAERKGYSGTAVFTKRAPLQVLHGLGSEYLDTEGRIVALEFPEFWFVDVYTPNAQNELARIGHRMEWDDAFRQLLCS